MGLETSTFINGLTPSWPGAGENKSQGDDHIRLIKSVLQNTFPNASKGFYFPKAEVSTVGLTLDITDQNNILMISTASGNINITLPTLGGTDGGWSCEIMKVSTDTNAVLVAPGSGNISSKCGSTATIRIGIVCEATRFIWSGSDWVCSKPGPMIGTTESYDGVTIPPGYLDLAGATFNATQYAELYAVLGTTTLRDKRGRVEAGVDNGAGRLTNLYFGTATLGAVGGFQSIPISQANLPSVTLTTNISDPGHDHAVTGGVNGGTATSSAVSAAGVQLLTVSTPIDIVPASTGITASTPLGGTNVEHHNVQPTIITRKMVRAC